MRTRHTHTITAGSAHPSSVRSQASSANRSSRWEICSNFSSGRSSMAFLRYFSSRPWSPYACNHSANATNEKQETSDAQNAADSWPAITAHSGCGQYTRGICAAEITDRAYSCFGVADNLCQLAHTISSGNKRTLKKPKEAPERPTLAQRPYKQHHFTFNRISWSVSVLPAMTAVC